MKRALSLKARQLAALPPGPIYRDIHPDKEAVALYDDAGNVAICCDLPTSLMQAARKLGRQTKEPVAAIIINGLVNAFDRLDRGF